MDRPFLKSLDASDLYTRRKDTKRGLGDVIQPGVAITQDYEEITSLNIVPSAKALSLEQNDRPPTLPRKQNSVKKRYCFERSKI